MTEAYALALKVGNPEKIQHDQQTWLKATETLLSDAPSFSKLAERDTSAIIAESAYDNRIQELKKTDAPGKTAEGTLTFEMKSTQRKIPSEVEIEYPVFKGTDQFRVARINSWLSSYFPSDASCEKLRNKISEGDFYHRKLKVLDVSTGAVAFTQKGTAYCAHKFDDERFENFVYLFEKNKKFGLDAGLTRVSEQKLIADFQKNAQPYSSPACRDEIESLSRVHPAFAFTISYPQIFISLPIKARDCASTLDLGIGSFALKYIEELTVRKAFEAFRETNTQIL